VTSALVEVQFQFTGPKRLHVSGSEDSRAFTGNSFQSRLMLLQKDDFPSGNIIVCVPAGAAPE
jgi:hypothetical protein